MNNKVIQHFILRIRNKEKKRYAYDYLYFLRDNNPEPNTKYYNLLYMDMQKIRMELNGYFKPI